MTEVSIYESVIDDRLGRHVVHDPQSRQFDLAELAGGVPTRPISWRRRGPIFDQGRCPPSVLATVGANPEKTSIGCCTMCAAFGLLLTEPFYRPGKGYTLADVLPGYHRETVLDGRAIPGVWPPEDTGSAGLYAMKVLRELGLISGWRSAFSLRSVLTALGRGPVAVGTNWYESMFDPVRRAGRDVLDIAPSAGVAGGHEWIIDKFDPDEQMVGMTNSWGVGWGTNGTAWLSLDTLNRLLHERGDAIQPTLPGGPS